MKKYFLLLALLLVSPAVFAADGCSDNSDACSAGTKKQSPFLKAAMEGNAVIQAAPAPAKKNRAVVKADAAPAVAASSAAVAAERLPGADGKLSNPAWLILVFAGFAGLYLYLKEGFKKRRRK